MADPAQQLFGRVPFLGSGRMEDYFPQEEIDLSYLNQGKPEYVPSGANYDPNLDAGNLVAQGIPAPVAMQFQNFRAQMHQAAAQKRAMRDEEQAMSALNKIDPSRESFAKDLLDIFNRYPSADQSPHVAKKIDLISKLSRMMPVREEEKPFDPDAIKDPDLYQQALTEGWDKLPSKQGQRRLYDAQARKERRLKLISDLGMTRAQVDDMEKSGGLTEEALAEAATQAKLAKPERNVTPEAARHLAELARKADEQTALLSSTEGKLAYLQEKYANGDPSRTTFTKQQWDEAYQSAQQPTSYHKELDIYQRALGMKPSEVTGLGPATKQPQSTEPAAPDTTVAAPNGKRYTFPSKEKADAFRKSIGQ